MIVNAHLDTLVVQLQAKLNSLVESLLRLVRGINVDDILALHVTLLMLQRSLDHSISDSFCADIFRLFFGIEMQFLADLLQRDARIGEGERTESSLDDVVTETKNQSIRAIRDELLLVCLERFSEGLQISDAHGCRDAISICDGSHGTLLTLRDLQIRRKRFLEHRLPEDASFRYISHQ